MRQASYPMLKNYWYVPLLLFCAWFWLREHDKLVLAQAQISAIADSSKAELKTVDSISNLEQQHAKLISQLNSQLVAHRKVDSLKQISSARTTDSLVSLLSDTTKAKELEVSFNSERASYQSQIADYSRQVSNLNAIIASKDSTISIQQLAISNLNTRLNSVIKIQRPGTLAKIASGIPYLAVGYILGKAI